MTAGRQSAGDWLLVTRMAPGHQDLVWLGLDTSGGFMLLKKIQNVNIFQIGLAPPLPLQNVYFSKLFFDFLLIRQKVDLIKYIFWGPTPKSLIPNP